MDVIGLQSTKPRSSISQGGGAKLQIGERFSTCGKFIITPSGQWKDVPQELAGRASSAALAPEFKPISPDGKPMPFGGSTASSPLRSATANVGNPRSGQASGSYSPGGTPKFGRRAASQGSTRSPGRHSPTVVESGKKAASLQDDIFGLRGSRPSSMSSAAALQREMARKLNI